MAYKFDISQLNPLKFYPLSDKVLTFPEIYTPNPLLDDELNNYQVFNPNYNTRNFDKDFFARNIPSYDQQRKYCQPFQQGDFIRVQFLGLADASAEYTAYILNSQNGEVLASMMPTEGANVGGDYLREVYFDLFSIPEGHYYVLIQCRQLAINFVGYERTFVISEPIHVAQTHAQTLLYEYKNSYNAQGIIFEELGGKFQFRVHSALTELNPDSKFTTYEDEPLNLEMLSGTPFRLWSLGIGGNGNPIPEWIADKIERITLCDTLKIDGKEYTRNEGAKLEANRKQRTPLYSWKITLRERINDNSVYINGEGFNVLLGEKLTDGGKIFVGTLNRPSSTDIVINQFFDGYTGLLQYLNSVVANAESLQGTFGLDAQDRIVYACFDGADYAIFQTSTIDILPYVLEFGIQAEVGADYLKMLLTPSGTTNYAYQFEYGGTITLGSTSSPLNFDNTYTPSQKATCLVAVDKAVSINPDSGSDDIIVSLNGYYSPETTNIVYENFSVQEVGTLNIFRYCTSTLTDINFQYTAIGKLGLDNILKWCFLVQAITICDLYLFQTPATPCSDDVAKNIVPYLRAKGMNVYLDSQFVPASPVNVTAPAITGTFQPSFYIICSNGTWTGYPTPSYTRVWEYSTNSGTTWNLFSPSETGSSYLVQSADVGRLIRCKVTALNSQGTAFVYSNSVLITSVGSAPYPTILPVISGTTAVGSVLSSTTGTWGGTATITYSYQWLRNGVAIGSATSSTYTSVSADLGQNIQCQVTATNSSGANTGESNVINPTQAPSNTLAPLVTGATTSGSTLSCFVGTWSGYPTPTYTYNWQMSTDNGSTWSNYSPTQTSSTYTLVSGDIGNDVRCQVTATNAIGNATANSNQVDIPAPTTQRPVNSVAPVVSGNPYIGQVLTTTNGTWTNSPTSYTYQWQRAGVDISSATSSTYTLVSADVDKLITCNVTATNTGGSEPQASNSIYAYDATFYAVITFATAQGYTLPTTAQQQQFSKLVTELKANSMWSIMDRFFMPMNNGSSNFGRINWMNPTTGTLLTLVNSPTWTSNVGFVGNGTNAYVDTNFNPSTAGVNYTLNNAGRYLFVSSRGTSTLFTSMYYDGNSTSNDNCMATLYNTSRNAINQGTTANASTINSQAAGYNAITRTASNAIARSNDVLQTATTASSAITNSNQFILRSGTTYCDAGIGFYAIGGAIPNADIPTHRAIINKYLNNL